MKSERSSGGLVRIAFVALAVVLLGTAGYLLRVSSRADVPPAGSEAYELTTRHFYRGLAALEVGLIDAAIAEFTAATEVAPDEPASWANLGLAHLRLGAFDAATPAIARAVALAPGDGRIAFLQARLDIASGRREEGILALRRAVDLDPDNLHARTTLAQEVENGGADDEAQQWLDGLAERAPDNPAVLVERARLAAKRGDMARLGDALQRLDAQAATWPPEVVEQYRALQEAHAASNQADASRAVAFLRNVLARVPAFLESRRAVTPSAELIAPPFVSFLTMAVPSAEPSAPDEALTFEQDVVTEAGVAPWATLLAVSLDGAQVPALFAANGSNVRRVDVAGSGLPFPGGGDPSPHGLLALDWNHDFRMDLFAAGPAGVRLFIQAPDGTFVDDTARASAGSGAATVDAAGAWAADVEMDGDLDIVVGVHGDAPVVLTNDGGGAWFVTRPFADVNGARAFVWGDLDRDGDPDAAFTDAGGAVHVRVNMQAGQFAPHAAPPDTTTVAGLTIADADADGGLDLITLETSGAVRRASLRGGVWDSAELARWPDGPLESPGASARVLMADLDNNGALDLVASSGTATRVWLGGRDGDHRVFGLLPVTLGISVPTVADLDADGQLDLAGLANGQPVRLFGRGTRGYHYQVVRPRAQEAAGDQRINTFGIGGTIEVRAGLLVQTVPIDGPVLHVGLGDRTAADVTRIVWPNGVPQAEFDPVIDQAITAEQRLKGSCPWIFADDGTGMKFVTDFLWRSPLGLRINAQDTAGATQTEDWIRIGGDQLAARNGQYDIRISAELWETHFIDRVALMVVDHPAAVEVFVDERFVPVAPPTLAVHAMAPPVPVARAVDQDGRDVTDVVARRDGRYLDTFDRGRYQGIAEEHFVAFDLAAPLPDGEPKWLVASGWIYPTDSSINVAIGQGQDVRPESLAIDALDARGRWVEVASDLGFPAGKNKTVLMDLGAIDRAGLGGATRIRLRTNLEVYWDAIATASGRPDATVQTTRVEATVADLRYRGFSETRFARTQPETPVYDRIANTAPRWRDLTGYYTKFGDVRPLLSSVEDRYVIMNAGDELRLSFPAPPPPPSGWTRDFVLIGDGWVKDGDYNTSFSKTVLPLPTHATAVYEADSPVPVLERDPVYLQHREDWMTFHTRFVAPHMFIDGLTRVLRRSDR